MPTQKSRFKVEVIHPYQKKTDHNLVTLLHVSLTVLLMPLADVILDGNKK